MDFEILRNFASRSWNFLLRFFSRRWKALSIASHYRWYGQSIAHWRLWRSDAVGLGTIGHEVAWHAARGTHSRHRFRWLVWLVPLAARPGVHPQRNEVFLLHLLPTDGQRHALNDACVLRTPCLEVSNRPEPPMIHHVWYCGRFISVEATFMATTHGSTAA